MLKTFILLAGIQCSFGFYSNFIDKSRNENTKIVGGKEVEIKEAPFIVQMMYDDRPLCGASIITTNFVISVSNLSGRFKNKFLKSELDFNCQFYF